MLVEMRAGGEEGQQRIWWLDGIIDSMDMSLSNLWEIVKDRGAWHAVVHGVSENQTWISDLTTAINAYIFSSSVC